MRHWSQLGMRNWRVKPGRTAGALAAIALGVGVVIWVTCAYESVRLALVDQVWFWTGRAQLSVESVYGPEGTVYQSVAGQVARLPNVDHVTAQLKARMMFTPLLPATAPGDLVEASGREVQAIGIDPITDQYFHEYDEKRVVGRPLKASDKDAVLVEKDLAASYGLEIGEKLVLRPKEPDQQRPDRTATFTIVGFVEHRRVAKQQLPIIVCMLDRLQVLTGYNTEPRRVGKVDIILKDDKPRALGMTELQVRQIADRYAEGFLTTSAQGKLQQVRAAEQQTGFVLLLISTVALFTAFFVILSTLSMGMVERIGQLGTLRCLGATRFQIATLVLAEAVPLGLVGVLLGVPVGLGLAKLSVMLIHDYVGSFAVSPSGLALGLIGGGVTTLLGAMLPTIQATRVSPLAASRPQSKPPIELLIWLAGLVGAAMIAGNYLLIRNMPVNRWFEPVFGPAAAVSGVMLLYCGYALITPALVRIFGTVAVRVAASALRIKHRLLSDQVGRATWRSAAICSGLMVGLSLIVSLVVHSESLARGWDFPKDFCESFIFVAPPVPHRDAERARAIGGLGVNCLVNVSTRCTVFGKGLLHFPVSRFIAGDPDDFFKIAKLEFIAGNQADAIAKLKRGGYILGTPEFTRSQNVGVGDKVRIVPAGSTNKGGYFEIAGVVTSPALDIAANYFNASSMLVATSAHVVLGTFGDMHRILGVPDDVSMFLINFNLPPTPAPVQFAEPTAPKFDNLANLIALLAKWRDALPERSFELDWIAKHYATQPSPATRPARIIDTPTLAAFREAMAEKIAPEWAKLSPEDRWRSYREELTMRFVALRSGAGFNEHASVRALKMQIDRDLKKATIIFTTIPMVALIVAALGVANLMMANVTSRTRQIAMLRAIGATKWQITRLIIGEALVLGTLGTLLGLALGLNAAAGMNQMTLTIWGYEPKWTIPWGMVGLGVTFTLGVCLLAGILPARRAARNNIIDALQTT
jgi:putative ABC transport system permease protein